MADYGLLIFNMNPLSGINELDLYPIIKSPLYNQDREAEEMIFWIQRSLS